MQTGSNSDGNHMQDIFCLHQFPEEIDETQSTFGGARNLSVTNIPIARFPSGNFGRRIRIANCFAAGNWVFFVSAGNKELKNPKNPVNPVYY